MSFPTALNVFDLCRSNLGDEAVSGGELYTNTLLLPFLNAANREMFRVLESLQLPRVKTYAYYNLPANTGVLYPATASITFLGNAFAAKLFLKENVDRRRWLAAIFVFAGVFLLVK